MTIGTKPGVMFTIIAPGGYAILAALKQLAKRYNITITSGTDGVHPAGGVNDPHYRGEAYDIRSHGMGGDEQQKFLIDIYNLLGTERFYALLEHPGEPGEHFHVQLRNGQRFTVDDLLDL